MPMNSRLTIPLLLASVLTLAAPVHSAEEKQPKPPPPAESPQVQLPPRQARTPPPAATFTPSEQIKADSSVSFPVDI